MYSLWFLRDGPDVLIVVGSGPAVHRFAGHRTLLASHSGYLKSQLTPDTHQVAVPNVSPEAFAPLLTFMYTGYLDLTPDNIYGVLLATHLLHMPRALDLCRAYLVQSQAPPPTLVKPVPSREPFPALLAAAGPPAYWSPPTLLPAPEPFNAAAAAAAAAVAFAAPSPASEPPPPAASAAATAAAAARGSPARERRNRDPSPTPGSLSPCLSQGSDASDRVTVTLPPQRPARREGKVIVDVASCDGPVRFHRVLNENYGVPGGAAAAPGARPPPDGGGSGGEVYACRHCEHTFKSRYCYRKHARRHLNPATAADGGGGEGPPPAKPKREVRLLDMNVQYYPCKTCGSKFPSYYFVHKHRKMCHPHEEPSSAPSTSGATASVSSASAASASVSAAPATPTGSSSESEITV